MSAPHVVIAGGGGALGTAVTREFVEAGYLVTALSRGGELPVAHEGVVALRCDVSDEASVRAAFARAIARGPVDVLIYNASRWVMAPFLELRVADFESAWRASVAGAVACAQAVLPAMLERGRGAIVFSGATAALRGGAKFAAFAQAKFALRGLAQSLAREFQPRGVHVAHVVIDGLLRDSAAMARFDAQADHTIDPADVARVYRQLVEQPRSAWTQELDLRPFTEKF